MAFGVALIGAGKAIIPSVRFVELMSFLQVFLPARRISPPSKPLPISSSRLSTRVL
ncbi:uncharacterized protein LDX57_010919 [Aspergillus melleus]|uniref:uncharacterized protein n=1 Tax=Aspergillus melleus TaxID=138277 RepID=UPI001E8DE1DA|nr:uncharacterized protein LDX57_010919 [Aspergillus melleus]KAH8433284.1 hypothetical protein LDX57_010919 [Aspergillus melleus]